MPINISRTLQKHSLWIAILLHFLFLLHFSWAFISPVHKIKETPALFIPSYIAQNPDQPAIKQQEEVKKNNETSKYGIQKPVISKQSMRSISQPIPVKSSSYKEPVHLIGDKKVDKGLLVVLGKALSAHLSYPKSAMDLNVRGGALIGFMLHPDGQVTEVQLLQSSSADILDQAAVNAANAMSPVKNVDSYLKQPKFMVIGVIFGCGLGVRC